MLLQQTDDFLLVCYSLIQRSDCPGEGFVVSILIFDALVHLPPSLIACMLL